MLRSLTKLIWQTKLPYHQMGKTTCFANIFLSFLPAALLLPLLYWTASFALFLILLPPPLVPEPVTLHFSHLSTFYPCSFLASCIPTQTPPPHLSLVASDHLLLQVRPAVEESKPLCSVSQVQEQPAEMGRSPGKVLLSPGSSGEERACLICGDGKSCEHWWAQSFGDKGCGLSSAKKKNGQKFSTPMFNTALLAMSSLWLVLPVCIAFHGDRRKHCYKIKPLLEAW